MVDIDAFLDWSQQPELVVLCRNVLTIAWKWSYEQDKTKMKGSKSLDTRYTFEIFTHTMWHLKHSVVIQCISG